MHTRARDNNALGGRGVAPRAQMMALNPLIQSTDVNLADAMARAWQGGAAVVNNSWGPPDPASGGTGSFYRASSVWQQAVLQGVTQGFGHLLAFADVLGDTEDADNLSIDHDR